MDKLIIDPEFRDKIPPLTEAEFEQLRENILSDGEVYEPIVVWNDTIIDGHNRWRVIQEHPEIPYRIKEMDFADKWEAFAWMYKNQLGRRNLTAKDRDLLIDSLMEARKKSHGGDRKSSDQSGHLIPEGKTRAAVAKELGVGEGTVQRAQQFGSGVRKMEEVSPEAASIIRNTDNVSRAVVREIPKMSTEEVSELAEEIVSGKKVEKQPQRKPDAEKSEYGKTRKQFAEIRKISEKMSSGASTEYTLKNLCAELTVMRDEFLGKVRNALKVRASVIGSGERVIEVLVSCEEKLAELEIEIEKRTGGKER